MIFVSMIGVDLVYVGYMGCVWLQSCPGVTASLGLIQDGLFGENTIVRGLLTSQPLSLVVASWLFCGPLSSHQRCATVGMSSRGESRLFLTGFSGEAVGEVHAFLAGFSGVAVVWVGAACLLALWKEHG